MFGLWKILGCKGGILTPSALEKIREENWRYNHSNDKYPYNIHCCKNYSVVSL